MLTERSISKLASLVYKWPNEAEQAQNAVDSADSGPHNISWRLYLTKQDCESMHRNNQGPGPRANMGNMLDDT